jgi:mannan endo-1,6-alpha-mannosidase
MSAAEFNFPNPPSDQPQWLALAQAVFNRQAARWDTDNCNGGLRWQFDPLNGGYNMKNTVSNGCFFLLASRLARYTNNDTYTQWAQKTYDWIASTALLENSTHAVFDGIAFTPGVCPTTIGKIEWTYNIGSMVAGCAYMYNYTHDEIWKTRIQGFLDHTQVVFFPSQYGGKIMTEYACEPNNNCNPDQRSFKAYLARWLAVTSQLVPSTAAQILPWIQGSATAAVNVCDGSGATTACGRRWYAAQNDGSVDVGNQMTAMSIVQSNLIMEVTAPVDSKNGTSIGNPAAGGGGPTDGGSSEATRPITTADRAGAWILTALVIGFGAFGAWFMLVDADRG